MPWWKWISFVEIRLPIRLNMFACGLCRANAVIKGQHKYGCRGYPWTLCVEYWVLSVYVLSDIVNCQSIQDRSLDLNTQYSISLLCQVNNRFSKLEHWISIKEHPCLRQAGNDEGRSHRSMPNSKLFLTFRLINSNKDFDKVRTPCAQAPFVTRCSVFLVRYSFGPNLTK